MPDTPTPEEAASNLFDWMKTLPHPQELREGLQKFAREQRHTGYRQGYEQGNKDAWQAVEMAWETLHRDHPDEDSPYYDGLNEAIAIIKSIGEDQLNQMDKEDHDEK